MKTRLLSLALLTALAATVQPASLRVYHVGNSVTDTINYGGLQSMVQSAGHTYIFGRHMIPGAPLDWIWNHPNDGFQEQPYGHYPNALPNYTWDVITLQPFDRLLTGEEHDINRVQSFMNLALQRAANKDSQLYIYSRWPRRPESGGVFGPFNFQTLWDRNFTGGWDNTNETRDFFKKLLTATQNFYYPAVNPKLNKKPWLVPVGDVLYELDKRMKAGQVPGYTDVVQVYADGIHFNNVGSFVVCSTFFATLYKQSPVGLPVPSQFGSIPAPVVAKLQQTVWDIVSVHPDAGVYVPTVPVKGKVTLSEFVGTMPKAEVVVKKDGVDTAYPNTVLAADGSFQVNTSIRGTVQVLVKTPTHLRKSMGTFSLGDAGLSGLVATLINGDCDGDNSVTVFDYGVLSDAFDTSVGDGGFDVRADLDGDGVVTVFDYGILSDAFDQSGD